MHRVKTVYGWRDTLFQGSLREGKTVVEFGINGLEGHQKEGIEFYGCRNPFIIGIWGMYG